MAKRQGVVDLHGDVGGISLLRPNPDGISSWATGAEDSGRVGTKDEGVGACEGEILGSGSGLIDIGSAEDLN